MIDINKKIEMCILDDYYGNLLTQKQKEIFEKFWEEDWSLFEIAEKFGISRQAVHDSLSKSEKVLVDAENKCNFIKKTQNLKQKIAKIAENATALNIAETKDALKNIIEDL